MDTIAVAPKGTSLASPKVVKNAKGNIVPSSQMAHIAYGCGKCLFAPQKSLLTLGRAHGRDVRERAKTDPPALPAHPPEYPRETEYNSTDIQHDDGLKACREPQTAVPVLAVSEHHDRSGPRYAL